MECEWKTGEDPNEQDENVQGNSRDVQLEPQLQSEPDEHPQPPILSVDKFEERLKRIGLFVGAKSNSVAYDSVVVNNCN